MLIACAAFIATGCGSPTSGTPPTESSSAAASSASEATSAVSATPTGNQDPTDTARIIEETPESTTPVIPEVFTEASDPIVEPTVEEDDGLQMTFTLPDGTTRKLSEFRGKRVLIDFWATW
jgi:hypothetical protein